MFVITLLGIAKPMPGGGPAELGIRGGEGRDADHLAVDVDERATRVAGIDRGARLDRARKDDAVALGLLAVEGADDALGEARG